MFTSFRLLAVLLLAAATLAANEPQFTTQAARAAQLRYQKRIAEIDAAHNKDIQTARAEYLATLRPALEPATRAGNLDEAVRIRAEISRLTAPGKGTPQEIRALSGKWKLQWVTTGNEHEMEIDDGMLLDGGSTNFRAPIRQSNGSLLSEIPTDNLELITHGDRIIVLAWYKNKKRTSPNQKPDHVAIMTRIE